MSTITAPKELPISTVPAKIPPEPAYTKADADKDNDVGSLSDDTNNNETLNAGQAADASDRHAITALIKRYYAAAYSESGARACAMLYSTVYEAVPGDYGQSPPGPAYMRGATCAAVLTLLFKHDHLRLAAEMPKLEVARVRVTEHRGTVILNFGTLPEREIHVAREGHTWRIGALLDSELP